MSCTLIDKRQACSWFLAFQALADARAFLMGIKGMMITSHEKWMKLALQLAKATQGQTSPNPMVGAVVVKKGQLLGTGVHLRAGEAHAEAEALKRAGKEAEGSTLYVTLEPCNHVGRRPPCTESILASGVRKVVVGIRDPDPRVSGEGVRRLREAGIEVVEGVLEEECYRLNEMYFTHRRTGRPFVTMKVAMSLDGKIATPTGDSRWISGEASRREVHRMRHIHDGILVGSGTVLKDRPRLTVRLPEGGIHPLRLVVDSKLRMPLDTPLANTEEAPTWVFCTEARDRRKEEQLLARGVKVVPVGEGSRVDLGQMFRYLGQQGILSVLAEGGGNLHASLLAGRFVDKVVTFIAPKLVGGKESPTAVEGIGVNRMAQAIQLKDVSVARFGEDLCVTGYPLYKE